MPITEVANLYQCDRCTTLNAYPLRGAADVLANEDGWRHVHIGTWKALLCRICASEFTAWMKPVKR